MEAVHRPLLLGPNVRARYPKAHMTLFANEEGVVGVRHAEMFDRGVDSTSWTYTGAACACEGMRHRRESRPASCASSVRIRPRHLVSL
jgi:hypothetical protein